MLALLKPYNYRSRHLYLKSSLNVHISSETNMFLENCWEAVQNGCPKSSFRSLGELSGLLNDLLETCWIPVGELLGALDGPE